MTSSIGKIPISPTRIKDMRAAGWWGDVGLLDYWDISVKARPDCEAVVDSRGKRLSYREVDEQASGLAVYLLNSGVKAGDVVSVQLPNWVEFYVANIACLKIGAIISPLLPHYNLKEMRYCLNKCRSVVLITAACERFPALLDRARQLSKNGELTALKLVLVVSDGNMQVADFPNWEQAIEQETVTEVDVNRGRGTDIAAVLFTSGSESHPKGVLLTHDNILSSERAFAYDLRIGFSDRMLMPAPVAHATGYLHGITCPFLVGGTSLLLEKFSGEAALRMINEEKATCGMGATTLIADISNASQSGQDLHSGLRFLCCGGAPIPRSLVEALLLQGVFIHAIYGATESAPHTATRFGDPLSTIINTDGRPTSGTEIKVVDPQTRQVLPTGEVGEAASRGPGVFIGYLGEPELTVSVLDVDGWYYSGDLATIDEDGYIRIVGRIKDVIVRGGQNISASEVEEIVAQYPGVKDVAVVGMPHKRLGETCCAYIVVDSGHPPITVDDLCAFFDQSEVAKYKTPQRVEIVDQLPRTATGKIRRSELRERVAAKIDEENRDIFQPSELEFPLSCWPTDTELRFEQK